MSSDELAALTWEELRKAPTWLTGVQGIARRLASDPAMLDALAAERDCLEDLQVFRRLIARKSRGFRSYARMMRRRDPKWRTSVHLRPYVPRWRKT